MESNGAQNGFHMTSIYTLDAKSSPLVPASTVLDSSPGQAGPLVPAQLMGRSVSCDEFLAASSLHSRLQVPHWDS